MNEQYAVLAAYYDRIMEDIDYEAWCDFYEACFTENGIKPKNILDLACGTGSITVPLAKRGYALTGIDLSSEMLSLAQEKSDEAKVKIRFSEQNIALFQAGGNFDAIICSFDGINYLTSPKDVQSCFASVAETLSDGGVFIFDISTPYKYENILADNAFVYEYDDLFLSWQNYFNKKTGLCDFYLTFFVKNEKNSWQRFDETQKQRKYLPSRLEKMLREAGLTVIKTTADLDFSPLKEDSDRCFFICKKATDGE
ncbi:MAG: class I SAM-dependent methyltransferase [Clostridia bacterium]|nr:class I SAM-dependent methyltransferase [Clostridia bacterium]